jgi:hypothetical protein
LHGQLLPPLLLLLLPLLLVLVLRLRLLRWLLLLLNWVHLLPFAGLAASTAALPLQESLMVHLQLPGVLCSQWLLLLLLSWVHLLAPAGPA